MHINDEPPGITNAATAADLWRSDGMIHIRSLLLLRGPCWQRLSLLSVYLIASAWAGIFTLLFSTPPPLSYPDRHFDDHWDLAVAVPAYIGFHIVLVAALLWFGCLFFYWVRPFQPRRVPSRAKLLLVAPPFFFLACGFLYGEILSGPAGAIHVFFHRIFSSR